MIDGMNPHDLLDHRQKALRALTREHPQDA
jgi:hypothetical protein